jgi:hypothetical protein
MWIGRDDAVATGLARSLLVGEGRGPGGRGRCLMLLLRGGCGWKMRLRSVKAIGLVSAVSRECMVHL